VTSDPAVLVAGIGNVFFGDDGFGVEVARRLASMPLPAGVQVVDYGIRGVHLAYDLLDRPPDTLVLVDAVPLSQPPGTLELLRVDECGVDEFGRDQFGRDEQAAVDAHTMNPDAVLACLQALGGHVEEVLVVGCQPAAIEPRMGLSAPVAAAVDAAIDLVGEVVGSTLGHTLHRAAEVR
jgi:hydrogenase maturation protease